ncbi:hypothetical protein [Rubrolithibacter danxiaensis]|uniref:hypothetical protein n=1 Tax=Rubrolithibacter danxiaensis TaxID=3390805 RepID=UPI003BF8D918
MTAEKDKRKELISFIDKKAFDVILHTSPDKFKGNDRENFEEILKKTENEKKKFHDVYKSAEEVKENFLDNTHSKPAQKLNKELEHLGLPTLPQIKDEFVELCRKLDI